MQSYLDAGGALERTKKLVIWHDVINNTLTPHKKTEACPISELLSILQKYKTRIEAIVYIQRFWSSSGSQPVEVNWNRSYRSIQAAHITPK